MSQIILKFLEMKRMKKNKWKNKKIECIKEVKNLSFKTINIKIQHHMY